MKNLLKNKVFIGISAAMLVIAITITAVLLLPDKVPIDGTSQAPGTSNATVNVPDISTSPETTGVTKQPDGETEKENNSDLVVDVGGTKDTDKNSDNSSGKIDTTEKPVTEVQPKDIESDGGIQIGGGDSTEKYSCGSPNHHCKNSEAHAYIHNLELEGCPYCGSHSCPSFYDVNEWGFTRYNQTLCPKYSEKSDPAKYCQQCGRELWSPSNPTGCFRYLQDTDCECGEHVKANACHHH